MYQERPRPPKRLTDYRMRTTVLPKIVSQVEERQLEKISAHSNWTLSIDGWTDVSKNNIYAVILVDLHEQHYLGDLCLGSQRHNTDNICEALKEKVSSCINRISAIVTDSPHVMIKVRANFCEENQRISNLSCCLHY